MILEELAPTDEEKQALEYTWEFWARPKQLPPEGNAWSIWLMLAGRGFGKTRALAEFARHKAKQMPKSRGTIIAATAADVRDVLVEGESGILAISPTSFMPRYEPSKRRLTWPNGTMATLFSADEPARLRGPQCHWGCADELAAWRYPETWDMMMFGARLGDNPQIAVATTPRPIPIIKQLLADPATVVTRGSTYENRGNLAPTFFAQIVRRYEGTRLGEQELNAMLLDDVPGALWNRDLLEACRVQVAPSLSRIVVAIDPPASHGENAAEAGIIVAGKDENDHGYILEDLSKQASPGEWGRAAVLAYDRYHADRIVAEANQGGDMVEHVIRTAARDLHARGERHSKEVSFKKVHASKGKYTRAEPISAEYERKRIHHVGMFALLEDQLCSWVPGEDSPDRLDALVWACTELALGKEPQVIPQASVSKRTL